MIRVRVFKDGQAQPPIDVRKDDFIIGRGAEADVQLAAEAVSRRHARMQKTADGWQIADLGAANGVYVSTGEGPPERIVIRPIQPGDQIHIEQFILVFEEVEDDAADLPEEEKDDFRETSLETKRTQFISMTDVLAARQAIEAEAKAQAPAPTAAPAEKGSPAPAAAPALEAAPKEEAAEWQVRLSSGSGHQRSFSLRRALVRVGSAESCEVRLPEGPQLIVELERGGNAVSLRRVSRWPFPRVYVDGRAVKEELLSDGDSFTVGDFELTVRLTPTSA